MKYQDVYSALRDHDTFASGRNPLAGKIAPKLALIQDDPPRHTRFRRLVNRTFTQKRIDALKVTYPDVDLKMIDTSVDFTSATGIEPNLNLSLETRVQRYDITMEISGSPGEIEATLRSPGVSQADVISLLLTGNLGLAESTSLAQTEVARGQLLMLLSGEIFGFAGRAVGLDSVQVGRGLGGAASDFDLLVKPRDVALGAQTRALSDCYAWPLDPYVSLPEDRALDDAAGCYEALADALENRKPGRSIRGRLAGIGGATEPDGQEQQVVGVKAEARRTEQRHRSIRETGTGHEQHRERELHDDQRGCQSRTAAGNAVLTCLQQRQHLHPPGSQRRPHRTCQRCQYSQHDAVRGKRPVRPRVGEQAGPRFKNTEKGLRRPPCHDVGRNP